MNQDLADLLEDLTANPSHPGITLICQGLAAIATDTDLTVNTTQVLLAELAGSPDSTDVLAAVGHLVEHLANADTNPALRALPADRQEEARKHGWTASYLITDPDLRNSASNANAALDTPTGTTSGQCSKCGQRFPDWPGGVCDACKELADALARDDQRPDGAERETCWLHQCWTDDCDTLHTPPPL